MAQKFYIDPDITRAKTLPSSFYKDPDVFEMTKDRIFYRSWQWVGDDSCLKDPITAHPFVLLPNYLDEPMLLSRKSNGQLHCLTNVCTHRGNQLISEPGSFKKLRCGYHGRRFKMDGTFEFMPEFNEVQDFPSACDHLKSFPLKKWGPMLFAGLDTRIDFDAILQNIDQRVGFLNADKFKLQEELNKDYVVEAHWALYCDNYLEGFHIPFVHEDLNAVLDYGNYETVLYDQMNLQIGYAEGSQDVFDFPKGHPDHGKKIAAYYYWVFPNMMFNFYPWGLSFNWVQPLGMGKTKVSFRSYVCDPAKLNKGAGTGLDKVELEDEEVVEGVHHGIRSHYYKAGRFSPSREKGVHHFHRLLAEFMTH